MPGGQRLHGRYVMILRASLILLAVGKIEYPVSVIFLLPTDAYSAIRRRYGLSLECRQAAHHLDGIVHRCHLWIRLGQ